MPLDKLIDISMGIGLVFLGILISRWFEHRDRERKKILQSKIVSTEAANNKNLGPISMSVEMSRSKRPSPKKQIIPVKKVYNYIIDITNIGTEDIEKPEISISFDNKATIINSKIESNDIPQEKIKEKEVAQNKFIVIPEYMNRRNRMTVSILSINNETENCALTIKGLGITHQRMSPRSNTIRNPFIVILVTLTIVVAVLFIFR